MVEPVLGWFPFTQKICQRKTRWSLRRLALRSLPWGESLIRATGKNNSLLALYLLQWTLFTWAVGCVPLPGPQCGPGGWTADPHRWLCICAHTGLYHKNAQHSWKVSYVYFLSGRCGSWIVIPYIVPGKHPPPIWQFFRVLCVTAHHAKFLHSKSEGRSTYVAPIILMHFGCSDIRHQRFAHTRPLSCSQHSSPAAQNSHTASNDWTCWNLATRLRVGPLCSMIQPSLLLSWP